MKNYKVTVLVAHQNYQEFLPSALESIKQQTYKCYTCVIDDCSEDQTSVGLITQYKLGLPETQIFGKEDIWTHANYSIIFLKNGPYGPSYARNRGIEQCWNNTDIFAVLDADDEMYPTKVEECVKIIGQSISEIGVVYADHDTLNTTTGQISREYREPYSLECLRQRCIAHSGSIISKYALEAVKDENGYYDEHLRTKEDFDLFLRIAEKFMIVHIPKALTLVKIQPNNSTISVDQKIHEDNMKRVYHKLQQRIS